MTYRRVVREVDVGPERFRLEMIADLDDETDRLCRRAAAERAPGGQLAALERAPYFGVLWPAAFALAGWLLERRERLAGARVLEVGCGLALPAMVAGRCGAHAVAIDAHPDAEGFLAANRRKNGLAIEFRTEDWAAGDPGPERFDLVIASDVAYHDRRKGSLPEALARRAGPAGRIVLADPGRESFDRSIRELAGFGFAVAEAWRRVERSSADDSLRGLEEKREIRIVEFSRA